MGIAPVGLRAPFPYLGNKARLAGEINRRLGASSPVSGSTRGVRDVIDKRPHVDVRPLGGAGKRGLRDTDRDVRDQIPMLSDTMGSKPGTRRGDRFPRINPKPGAGVGVGVSEVRRDKRPKVGGKPSDGTGVTVRDVVPMMNNKITTSILTMETRRPPGEGATSAVGDSQPQHGCFPGEHEANNLLPWFLRLRDRLRHIIVLNRDWTSAVTPSVLCDTPSNTPGTSRAILLDPPYKTEGRGTHYDSDRDGTSDDVAQASYDWALEHGERYRVAYCQFEDDFPVPAGWTSLESAVQHDRRAEQILFSPPCIDVQRQGALF